MCKPFVRAISNSSAEFTNPPPAPPSVKEGLITNGNPIKVWDFLNSIIEAYDLPKIEKSVSKKIVLMVALVLERIYSLLRIKDAPFITSFLVYELCSHHWFNISAAKQMLGYSPKIDFETGLKTLKH